MKDNKKRVALSRAIHGDRSDAHAAVDGICILTKPEPVPFKRSAKVQIKKRGHYRVGVLDQPI